MGDGTTDTGRAEVGRDVATPRVRSFALPLDPARGSGSPLFADGQPVHRLARVLWLTVLGVLVWAIVRNLPTHPPSLQWVAIPATVVGVIGCLAWVWHPLLASRVGVVVIAATGLAGVSLNAVQESGPGVAFSFLANVLAGTRLPIERCVALLGAELTVVWVAEAAGSDQSTVGAVALSLGLAAATFGGMARGQRIARAEQAELLLAQRQQTQEEHARAAALAERTRIAREIHDVLAHSLSALAVQLEVVDAMIDHGDVEQLREHVRRSRRLTAEGLAEAKRAVAALRADSAPLPDVIRRLADAHRVDTGVAVKVAVTGAPCALDAAGSVALVRTAQEALTNIRKHAPGATVAVNLDYGRDEVTLTVVNRRCPAADGPCPDVPSAHAALAVPGDEEGKPSVTAGDATGFGLVGMRERAELAGGRMAAGPTPTGWSVSVSIPTATDWPVAETVRG